MKSFILHRPSSPFSAEIILPASKSISNRLLVMQYLSGNRIAIENLSEADDTRLMMDLLKKIGHHVSEGNKNGICEIDCQNAGTVFRFLTAVLAQQPGNWILTGSDRMLQRPVETLCTALQELGASIEYLGKSGFPPVQIQGAKLRGGRIRIDASQSSQFVSAMLLIAPYLEGGLKIEFQGSIASRPYIDMTLSLIGNSGIKYRHEDSLISIEQGEYSRQSFTVEPDWSSASYGYEAVALMPGSQILFNGLSMKSIQGDAILSDVFKSFGIGSQETGKGLLVSHVAPPAPTFSYNFSNCPDLVPAIAATCTALNIGSTLSGLINLRIKESDRLQALQTELSKINSNIEISGKDTLQISKQSALVLRKLVHFETYQDHRLAMALAPLVVCCETAEIDNPMVVAKSYPDFWDDLRKLGFVVKG
ncbi:MAG: 3-phosphoshikimate 1-carboxyvinyltransferase [Bacteroidales bacterium]|nr:3-phosphoshikimate 1-carboxyvinyltransferase [Bacteroidales bacterium]